MSSTILPLEILSYFLMSDMSLRHWMTAQPRAKVQDGLRLFKGVKK